ncbi:MAG: chorismate mutase [Pseudomonadota bacterium]
MAQSFKDPKDCKTIETAREEIDRLDVSIVDLLVARWAFQDRMWQLKQQQAEEASVPWRNREVIERVRARAEAGGMPAEMAESLWRQIIGWGIQYQDERLRKGDGE